MTPRIKNQRKPWSCTLIEFMSTMTVIVILSVFAYLALKSDLILSSQKSKLPQGVGALTWAVSTYLAFGGSLEGVATPSAVRSFPDSDPPSTPSPKKQIPIGQTDLNHDYFCFIR